MLLKTDAVVLKQHKFGEADAILTLFSRKAGKIQAVAKGSRRIRGKYSTGTQIFSYSEFILFKGRDLYQVSQVDIKYSFYKRLDDIIKLSYASYILELTESVITEGQTNNRLFNTLVKWLYIYSTMNKGYETFVKAYELKLLTYTGYKPEIDRCVNCGKSEKGLFKFSSKEGGLICKDCLQKDIYAMQISKTTISVIKYLIQTDLKQISRLKIKPEILKELNKIIRHYIRTHIEKTQFYSLQFLEDIK